MEALVVKCIAALVLLLLALGGGLLPLAVSEISPAFVSLSNVLAAGVLLATGCVHLLADSQELLEPAASTMGEYLGMHEPFPLANFLMCAGFLMLLLVEQTADLVQRHKSLKDTPSSSDPVVPPPDPILLPALVDPYLLKRLSAPTLVHLRSAASKMTRGDVYEVIEEKPRPLPPSVAGQSSGSATVPSPQYICGTPGCIVCVQGADVLLNVGSGKGGAAAFIMFVALAFHSAMEGIGLAVRSRGGLADMLVGLLIHKGLEAFALGSAMLQSGVSVRRLVVLISLFALMTPMAMLVGGIVMCATTAALTAEGKMRRKRASSWTGVSLFFSQVC
mmetsp:Transcript_43728/g.109126  ORF Transcript_43728/g.109126 Transcript_43728/m.109126 type:complete len:333 (-) Transcript_43728:1713-2711(-)